MWVAIPLPAGRPRGCWLYKRRRDLRELESFILIRSEYEEALDHSACVSTSLTTTWRHKWSGDIGVRQGVAMDSPKYHSGSLCLTLLRPVGEPPLKRLYSRFGWPVLRSGGLQTSPTPVDTPCHTHMSGDYSPACGSSPFSALFFAVTCTTARHV
jgi:hypothetical protein